MTAVSAGRQDPEKSQRYLDWLLRHRVVVLVVAGALAAFAGWRTVETYGNLRSDLEELLPADAPSVRALEVARQRLPGLRHLGIVVSTGGEANTDAALRFIDDLAVRIRAYPEGLAGNVRADVRAEREFVETYAFQLMDPDDVGELRESVEDLRDWHATRGMGMDLLDEEEDPKPVIPIDELKEKYQSRQGRSRSFPNDRFVSEDGSHVVLIVQTASHNTGFEGDDRLLSHVRADVSDLNFPGAYAPGMTLGYAGDVPAQVEELKGLIVDLSLSGLLVLLLVCGAVVWFFRSLMSLVVLGVPLVFGTFYTFALVALPPLSITALNSNTAFLGAIVVGNGINTGVIVLARYQEERSRGMTVRAALGLALRKTWKPTLGAAFAASAAYGSLIFTDFRGFNQFGWIGAVGMLACWGTTMALAPVLVHYVGAGIGARARVHAQAVDSAKGPRHRNVFAVAVTRYPRGILVVCLLATIASVFAMNARRNDWLENDFTNLRRRDSFVSGERYWSAQMDKTLETYLTPAVVMASSAQAAEIIERKIRGVTEQGGAGDWGCAAFSSTPPPPSPRRSP